MKCVRTMDAHQSSHIVRTSDQTKQISEAGDGCHANAEIGA